VPGATYARFVNHVCDRIAALTGHEPFYVDATTIASYCPACLAGTMLLRFSERTGARIPAFVVSSATSGRGACSEGCSEAEIGEVIFA
jgi:hypothetical protein